MTKQSNRFRILTQRRPDRTLATAFQAVGGVLDEVDLITRHDRPAEAVRAAFAQVENPRWIVLTSPYAVGAIQRAEVDLGGYLEQGTRLATIGCCTTAACEAAGLSVALQPEYPQTGGAALAERFPPGSGLVLIPGAAAPAGTLEPRLKALGWTLEPLPVYVTETAVALEPEIKQRWSAGEYHALIATSPSVVRAAVTLLDRDTRMPCVTVGPSSYRAALDAGFDVVAANSPTPDAVVAAVLSCLSAGER